jgi:hypothetical protein
VAPAQLFELSTEPERGGQRVTSVVRLGKRCTEDAQGGIAFEHVDPAALCLDGRDHGGTDSASAAMRIAVIVPNVSVNAR